MLWVGVLPAVIVRGLERPRGIAAKVLRRVVDDGIDRLPSLGFDPAADAEHVKYSQILSN